MLTSVWVLDDIYIGSGRCVTALILGCDADSVVRYLVLCSRRVSDDFLMSSLNLRLFSSLPMVLPHGGFINVSSMPSELGDNRPGTTGCLLVVIDSCKRVQLTH